MFKSTKSLSLLTLIGNKTGAEIVQLTNNNQCSLDLLLVILKANDYLVDIGLHGNLTSIELRELITGENNDLSLHELLIFGAIRYRVKHHGYWLPSGTIKHILGSYEPQQIELLLKNFQAVSGTIADGIDSRPIQYPNRLQCLMLNENGLAKLVVEYKNDFQQNRSYVSRVRIKPEYEVDEKTLLDLSNCEHSQLEHTVLCQRPQCMTEDQQLFEDLIHRTTAKIKIERQFNAILLSSIINRRTDN